MTGGAPGKGMNNMDLKGRSFLKLLDFTQDDCDKADQLNVGDDVEVEFRLNGRKWQRDPSSEVKYFLNAEAMNFRVLGQNPAADASSVNDQFADAGQDDDEVPF